MAGAVTSAAAVPVLGVVAAGAVTSAAAVSVLGVVAAGAVTSAAAVSVLGVVAVASTPGSVVAGMGAGLAWLAAPSSTCKPSDVATSLATTPAASPACVGATGRGAGVCFADVSFVIVCDSCCRDARSHAVMGWCSVASSVAVAVGPARPRRTA